MENMTGLISFGIADILVSMLGSFVVRQKYPKENKYLLFLFFFFGYIGLFYLISKV